MLHTIDFETEPDRVVVRTFGTADVAGFRAMSESVVADGRFLPGMPILLDHSHLDASRLTAEDVQEISEHVLSLSDRLGGSSVAVIAADAVTQMKALASIEQLEGAGAAIKPRVFDYLAEGTAWLRGRPCHQP